ncbi:MAG: hypothetical protein ABFD98_05045 [Syntrophobacteraceae bacterium]
MKIEAGTKDGSLHVYTRFGNDEYDQDNLAADYFTLQYTGALASCVAQITGTSFVVKAGTSGSETAIYTADLTVYNTVEKLVDFLDAQSDLTAAVVAKYREYPTVNKLDYSTGKAIAKTAGGTAITANLQAVVDWIASAAEPLVEIYRPTQAGTAPATIGWTYLVGGGATAPTTTDWTDALALLQTEDVQFIVLLTSDAAIHAAGDSHCDFMSRNGQMERRCISGGALGETLDEVTARAADLNSDRFYLVSPGFVDYDESGNSVTYAPYMAAAIIGGMACGVNPGTPLTNKIITVRGLEKKYRIPSDTDDLINGGVLALISTKQGYKVCKSISTWLANRNYNRVEMSTGVALDYVMRNVREAIQPMLGKKGRPLSLVEIATRVDSCLRELARPEPLGPEVIVGDSANPAYKNIVVTLEGDVVRISFQCSPCIPINYELVTTFAVPYSGSYTVSAQ